MSLAADLKQTESRAEKNLIMCFCKAFYFKCSYVLGADRHRLVAYWGQNAVYNMKKERQYWEKDLVHFCQNSKYDVVVLAFMHVFFNKRQKGLVFSKINSRGSERPLSVRIILLLIH